MYVFIQKSKTFKTDIALVFIIMYIYLLFSSVDIILLSMSYV